MNKAIIAAFAMVLAIAPIASATVTFTVYRIDDTTANITVTGDDSATQGSFANNPSQRWARLALINDATHLLWGTTPAASAVWTYTSTDMITSAGSVPFASGTSYDTCYPTTATLGGESKLIVALTANPAVGNTITGSINGVTLPTGFTWGTVGTTGTLRWGQNNSGTSQQNLGTWVIASSAPATGDLTVKEFFDCYRDGAFDGADKMLTNQSVTITGVGGYSNTTTTDVNGEIALTGLAAGEYTISRALLSAHTATTTDPMIVTVTAGGTTTAWVGDVMTADINQDGIVDSQDFTALKAVYGTSGKIWTDGDVAGGAGFLGDGTVDSQDFTALKAVYGQGALYNPSSVPEPATMTLLALAGLGLIRRNRK